MIYFVAKHDHLYTWRRSIEHSYSLDDPAIRRELFDRITLVPYRELFERQALPSGSYVFADLERLSTEETERAAIFWQSLVEQGAPNRVFNNPVVSMRRYELLRHLYESGINDFNVQRLTEPLTLKHFPVFIRNEADHNANITPLLHNRTEFEQAVKEIAGSGQSRDDKIVVEYIDTRDDAGSFHRFSAMVADTRITSMYLSREHEWIVKDVPTKSRRDQMQVKQEYADHHETLLRIFRMANIEFGRVDYAVVGGKIQVFEINTNPTVGGAEYLLDIARMLDTGSVGEPVKITREYRLPRGEKTGKSRAFRLSRRLHLVLRRLGLLDYETRILKLGSALNRRRVK